MGNKENLHEPHSLPLQEADSVEHAFIRRLERLPLLTSEEKAHHAKSFSRIEIATSLLHTIQTGIREEKKKLTHPDDRGKTNPPLSKEAAEELLEASSLTEKIKLLFADNEKDIQDNKQLTDSQKEQRRAVVGYQWQGEITSDNEKEQAIKSLEQIIEDAENSKETMINHNLRLAVFIANKYRTDLSQDDRIQASYFGLRRAVEKFDYRKGHEFSTYASTQIKRSIQIETWETARTIRFPTKLEEAMEVARKLAINYRGDHGEDPTRNILLGLLRERNLQMSDGYFIRATDMLFFNTVQNLASLDAPVSDKPDATHLREFIPDEASDQREAIDTKVAVQDVLKGLTELEQNILALSYWAELPQEDIAQKLGVTKTKVIIAKKAIMRKLRKNDTLLELYEDKEKPEEKSDAFTQIFHDTPSHE